MLAYLFMAVLLILSAEDTVRPFEPLAKEGVPAELLASEAAAGPCDYLLPAECQAKFLREGEAWSGDVDDDGNAEILLYPHSLYAGTGGRTFFLFQRREEGWVSLFADNWLIAGARLQILPRTRMGYHDLRLGAAFCLKWNGSQYIPYEGDDYRALPAEWFDATDLREAEMFWKVGYAGEAVFRLEPQWFPGRPRDSINVELEDGEYNLHWLAAFKGGVFGERNGRVFLLVPRPGYRGSEELELKGDWLLVFDKDKKSGRPVACYNRQAGELRLEAEWKPGGSLYFGGPYGLGEEHAPRCPSP